MGGDVGDVGDVGGQREGESGLQIESEEPGARLSEEWEG
jgi:hypothetical protein